MSYDKSLVISIQIPLALGICIVYTLVTLIINRYFTNNEGKPFIHQSSVASLIGLAIGFVLNYIDYTIDFNSEIFFYMVLPPIIFNAGYTLKKKKFFEYLPSITLYGIIGTLINFFIIAFAAYYYPFIIPSEHVLHLTWHRCLLLASVLAATDEVSAMALIKQKEFPRLGALIFGEGVINDAISIVLFKALLISFHQHANTNTIDTSSDIEDIQFFIPLMISVSYQIIASCCIGLTCGLLNARVMKVFSFSRHYPIHQLALIMLTGYFSYSLSEVLEVSGILTLFVTAVTLAHYSWHSLSKSSKLSSQLSVIAISEISEGFAFSYVGLSLWDFVKRPININFAIYMLVIVIIARTIAIFGLGYGMKCFTKDQVSSYELLAFVLGGISRGCLCWAQVLQIGNKEMFLIQTTLVIVMSTTVGCGLLLPAIIPKLTSIIANDKYPISLYQVASKGTNGNRDLIAIESIDIDDNNSTYSMHLEGSLKDSEDSEDDISLDEDGFLKTIQMHFQNPIGTTLEQGNVTPMTSSIKRMKKKKMKRYSLLYILWLRFDELFMKPTFGGSETQAKRKKLLMKTKDLKTLQMLSPMNSIIIEETEYYDNDMKTDDNDPRDDSTNNSYSKALFPKSNRDMLVDGDINSYLTKNENTPLLNLKVYPTYKSTAVTIDT